MKRRAVLASAGTPFLASITTFGLSGCLSSNDTGASVLGEVTIVNRDDERHTVDFRVKWGKEMVHRSTHKLTARTDGEPDGAVPERTWPSDAGQFTVSARKQGEDWHTVDPSDRDYPDCYGVYVDINESGRLAIYTSTNSNECSDEVLESGRKANDSGTNS